MSEAGVRVLAALRHVRRGEGEALRVMFEGAAGVGAFARVSALAGESALWRSCTPYLHPWFLKKREMRSPEVRRAAIVEQVRREWRARDGAAPEIVEVRELDSVHCGGRALRPVHFHRFRRKRDLAHRSALRRRQAQAGCCARTPSSPPNI